METKELAGKDLPRTLKIVLQNNTIDIPFPSIGKIIDIETNKVAYSSGRYAQLIKGGIISSNVAVDLVEMAASFTVIIPDFDKMFKLDSIFDMNPIEAQEFLKEYKEKFFPWYSEWLRILRIEPKLPSELEEEKK